MSKTKVNWMNISTEVSLFQQRGNCELTEVTIQRYNPKTGRLYSKSYETITHASFMRLTRWIGENTR